MATGPWSDDTTGAAGAPLSEHSVQNPVRFGLKERDHNKAKDRAEQSLLNKLAKDAALVADVTIWGLGKDRHGSRMGRAVNFLKRVADPKDPWTHRNARHATRRKSGKRAKKPTVAKTKKSA